MKPILFNTENVRAILEGRKTATRRIVKPQPDYFYNCIMGEPRPVSHGMYGAVMPDKTDEWIKPPVWPGDILWVRETFQKFRVKHPGKAVPDDYHEIQYEYKADGDLRNSDGTPVKWRPNIHMPWEAARIFLRVTGFRVERLRDMTLGDVIMEGIKEADEYEKTWDRWHQTWNSTIKPEDLPSFGWEANPWVWVIGFERISREEANHGKDSV